MASDGRPGEKRNKEYNVKINGRDKLVLKEGRGNDVRMMHADIDGSIKKTWTVELYIKIRKQGDGINICILDQ